jgi:hypothetical protein
MVGPYRSALLAAVLALGAVLTGCRGSRPATLADIQSVDELKSAFNRDAGKPRVVLLLSPT